MEPTRTDPARYRKLFQLSSRLTQVFPAGGARLLDAMLTAGAGNGRLLDHLLYAACTRFRRVERFDRLLVIADLNIGDAVLMQSAVAALRDFLPDARIDYVISQAARRLVAGNPDITELFAVFHGGPAASREDVDAVRSLVLRGEYDAVLNFCPMIRTPDVVPPRIPVLDYKPLAAILVHGLRDPAVPGHVVAQTHDLVHRVLGAVLGPGRERPLAGISIQLSNEAVKRASAFLSEVDLAQGSPFLVFNPDTSSPYTRVPIEAQVTLLGELTRLPIRVVLGAGHREPGIEERLMDRLTMDERRQVSILPASIPLDTYAAIVDSATFFFSGDTGPLHVAAARKVSRTGRTMFNNRTIVISAFGATPARFYGYASDRAGFFPANQAAPSFVHVAASPCRNLTCVNKMAKTCRVVRCFEELNLQSVMQDVRSHLSQVPSRVA